MTKPMLAVVLLSALAGSTAAQSPSIQGVWRPVEITITAAASADRVDPFDAFPRGTHTTLQPALVIFTARHYSRTTDTAAQPRPATGYRRPNTPTVQELIARWGPFAANAGTYELSGNTLTIHTLVAKEPMAQREGNFTRFIVAVDGNTLTLTTVENEAGRFANPLTSKYVRVE